MKYTYYSTFTSGFSDLALPALRQYLKFADKKLILDGLVLYETEASLKKIQNIPFANNSFFLLFYTYGKESSMNKMLSQVEQKIGTFSIPGEILAGKKSFRVIFSHENQLISVPKNRHSEIEFYFAKKLRLEIDRANPDVEVWFLERSEGYVFCGIRLTKKPSTEKYLNKGQLRPELAWFLSYVSEPLHTDVFLDPFAGYGSIPKSRMHFPYQKIIATDIEKDKVLILKEGLSGNNIEIHSWDACQIPLPDSCVTKIVTDPPWGQYSNIQIEELYQCMFSEFYRLLTPKGILVLLTSQKDLVQIMTKESKDFTLVAEYHVLVSGKKSAVYKFQKNE